jgi:hypothetical protein
MDSVSRLLDGDRKVAGGVSRGTGGEGEPCLEHDRSICACRAASSCSMVGAAFAWTAAQDYRLCMLLLWVPRLGWSRKNAFAIMWRMVLSCKVGSGLC